MKAKDIMHKDPACCTPTATLEEAARIMVDHDCGSVPVIQSEDTRRLEGVITDRDIVCRGVAQGKNPRDARVAECFSETAVSVTPESSLEDCLGMMERNQVRRLPVVDESGRCVGIVTQAQAARNADDRQAGRLLKDISRRSRRSSSVPTGR
jgi:CBS domain-containing protein